MPEAEVGLERVAIEVEQTRVRPGLHFGDDPRHIDVEHEDQVGFIDQRVAAVADVVRVVAGEVHVLRVHFAHGEAHAIRQFGEFGHRLGLTTHITRDDQRLARRRQGVQQFAGAVRRQPGHERRLPVLSGLFGRHRRLVPHLACAGEVHGAGGLGAGQLDAAHQHLVDHLGGAHFVRPLHVLAADLVLACAVLRVVDELGARAHTLAAHRYRGKTGDDDRRHPAACCVVDAAAQVLRAHVHVHQHHLRLAGFHGVAVCGAEGGHLVRADDDLRHFSAVHIDVRKGLDERRVVTAQVAEDVVHAQTRCFFKHAPSSGGRSGFGCLCGHGCFC